MDFSLGSLPPSRLGVATSPSTWVSLARVCMRAISVSECPKDSEQVFDVISITCYTCLRFFKKDGDQRDNSRRIFRCQGLRHSFVVKTH